MATRAVTRFISTARNSIPRSYTAGPSSSSTTFLPRLRPLAAASDLIPTGPVFSTRGFSSSSEIASLSNPKSIWSSRRLKETPDGRDFRHWLVVMEEPEGISTRDEIIDSYVKTLAKVVGSEEEAKKRIYSVSTKYYFAFGALVPEELSHKLKELPKVQTVFADSYVDAEAKVYRGEPFIEGEAVPYDPKYHAEWEQAKENVPSHNARNIEREREIKMAQNLKKPNSTLLDELPPHTMQIRLPTTRALYTVLRSPHIDKKSREQFHMKIKRMVIKTEARDAQDLRRKFFWLKRRSWTVQASMIFDYQTRLPKQTLAKLLNGSVLT